MKCLTRNKQPFYYALFKEKRSMMVADEYGNGLETGEYDLVYDKPVALKGNISAAKGETETRQFGEDLAYDKVIVIDNPNTPIDEFSVLWIDKKPVINTNLETDTPHDYVVSKIARSINSVSIAISKVDVRK